MSTPPANLAARHNVLVRHYGADHPAVEQAHRALELARTERRIAKAIAESPPLDAESLARLRALIPAVPTPVDQDVKTARK